MSVNPIMKQFSLAIISLLLSLLVASCIEDDITYSPADQPVFSTDTLRMGAVFTDVANPTFSFKVYNRHDKVLNISSIRLRSGESTFRLNVDGLSATTFNDIEIRPNDSIYVFVAVTLPPNGDYQMKTVSDVIEFVTNGVTSEVVVTADGTDVDRLHGLVIESDTRWVADRPRQVFDSLIVAPGATLTIEAGAKIYFHDGASMSVRGTLVTEGEAGRPVEFTGDRTGNVVTDIPFELMSRQWEGLYFESTSRASRMSFTEVRNTWNGVVVDSVGPTEQPVLTLHNSRLRNSARHALDVRHAKVEAYGCEFAEAGYGPVSLTGGEYRFVGCTFSNYYLFSAIMGPLAGLWYVSADDAAELPSSAPLLRASFVNCIFYGSGADMSPGDLEGAAVEVRNCLLRSAGEDDDNFVGCLWDTDPLFYTVRSEYIFDYRLHPDSPAIGKALPDYAALCGDTDYYGAPRTSLSLGAYEPREPLPTDPPADENR